MDDESNEDYWYYGNKAFKYFHQGIGEFADKAVAKEHARILKDREICPEQKCIKCNLSNLKPLHSPLSVEGRKLCPYRQRNCNCVRKNKLPCPVNVCDAIYEEILIAHVLTSPNWKNTDINKWTSNPWEVAKCFINTDGYADKKNANDIDVSGILQIFTNNINLNDCLSEAQKPLLSKMLDARNALAHSPNMTVSKDEKNNAIDGMISILDDEKNLKHNDMAKNAVCSLKELKDQQRDKSDDIGCAFCSAPVGLKDVRHLERGQHISFERKKGTYTHHAIVTKVIRRTSKTCAEVELIHFSKENNTIKVIKETQIIDLKKDKINIVEYKYRKYSADETVQRAEEVRAQANNLFNSYNPFTRNCEHLASWCIVGGMVSLQVDELILAISNVFLEFFKNYWLIGFLSLLFGIEGKFKFAFVIVVALIFLTVTSMLIITTVICKSMFRNKQMCELCLKRKTTYLRPNFIGFFLLPLLKYIMLVYFDHLFIHFIVFFLIAICIVFLYLIKKPTLSL